MEHLTQHHHGSPPQKQSPYRFEPGLPMVLSLFVPGLGQFYDGRRFSGCLWLFTTLIGYISFILPGVVLHVLAVSTAGFRRSDANG
jgi:TM2 domain-containing membrane protein YozV